MALTAILSIDDGETLNDATSFEARPQVGEKIRFWKNGREAVEAVVTGLAHHQTEAGYVLVVEAKSEDIDAWIESLAS